MLVFALKWLAPTLILEYLSLGESASLGEQGGEGLGGQDGGGERGGRQQCGRGAGDGDGKPFSGGDSPNASVFEPHLTCVSCLGFAIAVSPEA